MSRIFSNTPQRFATPTVEVEATPTASGLTFCVRGVHQKQGDRSRATLGHAQDLEAAGKAKIIEGSERVEML